ncbi:squalene-associated FAD-dependent desaturase [Pseudacidovorax intermedius]|uniref:Squalene-associated FAD-dependent desaturase n=1 Tax=Pseudacidovorax intermedius TaxID=433924 RepID=A0A370FKB9_9BURK|nr:hydroxysqualene dehydroxylase HpnE [Pseudacidovorax intermedius]RDI25028.1 squalene-associated FAD-dependent desaturase [Pseudacidovorax intermedius]
MKLAVIGAGWAGLACAVAATRAGARVTVFESARQLGGRARRVEANGLPLDNGQHILIGAYTATLGLMRELGISPEAVLERQPLDLRHADGRGLKVPARLPPPLDLAVAIATARGWTWRDKLSLLRTAARWRRAGFACDPSASVADLCSDLAPAVQQLLVEPLCVSALNTPMHEASGTVFLRVLRDALFGERGGADLLLPRVDLGALLPDAAAGWLDAQGTTLRLGTRVDGLARAAGGWRIDGEAFDRIVLATSAWEGARLAESIAPAWAAAARALDHVPIGTVYLRHAPGLAEGTPLRALSAGTDQPAQFVFDLQRLRGHAAMAAFVCSACSVGRETLTAQVLAQAAAQLGWRGLEPVLTVVEKRATFACRPGLVRPAMAVAPGLLACGDHVEGPYPATLEGAARSGLAAAAALQ